MTDFMPTALGESVQGKHERREVRSTREQQKGKLDKIRTQGANGSHGDSRVDGRQNEKGGTQLRESETEKTKGVGKRYDGNDLGGVHVRRTHT